MQRPLPTLRAVVLGAAALTASLAGIAGWAVEAAADIKIGSVLAVTGRASFLGDPEEKTLKMYVDKINAEGGLLGEQIELVIYDSGGDANKARTFATRLIEEDGIVAMVDRSNPSSSRRRTPIAWPARRSSST
jgi:branched-chain amino acid transport system substrate-binding protein